MVFLALTNFCIFSMLKEWPKALIFPKKPAICSMLAILNWRLGSASVGVITGAEKPLLAGG